MGLSFGTSYQIGYYAQTPCYPQLDWIANVDSQLNLKPDNFERAAAIGKGKFGLVFLALHKPNGKFVAIKYITKQSIYDSQKLQKFQQEINVLQSLNHPFLMHYFGGFEAQACIALVCEYAFGGELYNRMKKRIKFSENEAKFYFCEVACALRYLQETMQLVYRDLKPENILIDFAGHVKICDFGFTAPCTEDENDLRDGCGTAMYIAPEVASGFMKGSHGFPVDWWALGCVLFEMIAGEAPFGDSDSLSKFEIFNNITEKTVLYPLRMSISVKQLLKGLLDKNPNSRFSWQQVSSSAWLQDVNWSRVEERKLKPPWIPGEVSGKVDRTMNFIKWDLALPTEAPSHLTQTYCSTISFSSRGNGKVRGPGGAPVSSKLNPERTPNTAQLRTERSHAALNHQTSSIIVQDKQESTKMVRTPSSQLRRKSNFDNSSSDLNETVSGTEKLKRRSSSRVQRGDSQLGGSLQRSPSRMSNSPVQIHPH